MYIIVGKNVILNVFYIIIAWSNEDDCVFSRNPATVPNDAPIPQVRDLSSFT